MDVSSSAVRRPTVAVAATAGLHTVVEALPGHGHGHRACARRRHADFFLYVFFLYVLVLLVLRLLEILGRILDTILGDFRNFR